MLNPALVAAILAAATEEYLRLSKKPMPAPYVFLIVPIVLHRDTRESLPSSNRSHWSTWAANNPLLMVGFPLRALAMRENVREGLRFALRCGALEIDENGALSGKLADNARPAPRGDVRALIAAAGRVGRWLTKLDQPATAFAILGVRP